MYLDFRFNAINNPLISVLLPVFNAEKYLYDSIKSVLEQTFQDFELIIVNDGSTDNSLEVIKKFTDQRIVLIDQPNKGLAAALNAGAAFCKGVFIARMDADDICSIDRFQKQADYLTRNPQVSVVSSAVIYIDEKKRLSLAFRRSAIRCRKFGSQLYLVFLSLILFLLKLSFKFCVK